MMSLMNPDSDARFRAEPDRRRARRLRRAHGCARGRGRDSRRSMSPARRSPTRVSAAPTSASSRMTEVAETLALIRDRVAALPHRRCRHRLRQCAQRPAHRAAVRARRRERDPARGPELSQALRPPRRQGLIPAAEMAGKIKRRRRCARAAKATLIIARTDAVAVEGLRRRHRRAPACMPRPAPTCCSSRRRSRASSSPHRDVRARRHFGRCWPTWSRAADTPLFSAAELERSRLRAGHLPRRRSCAPSPRPRGTTTARSRATAPTSRFATACSISTSINALIGTPEMLALGKSYEDSRS